MPDTAGHLTARGTLFMRAGIYTQRTSAGEQQLLLQLLERRGAGVQRVTATWCGPEADEFMRLHGPHLKPGAALHCEFSRLYSHNNELHGVIHSVHLATPRWGDKAGAATTTSTAHHAPNEIRCSADARQ
jgi:hypothetical protein